MTAQADIHFWARCWVITAHEPKTTAIPALAFANAVALLYTICSFEKIMEATLSQ